MAIGGNTIKEFLVALGFKVDNSQLKKFEGGIGKAGLAVAGLGAAVGVAAVAIERMVTGVAKELDAVSDLGKRVNTTATELMRMQYVASLTDASAEAAAASFDGLNRIMGEAATGVGRGAVAFEKYGLSVKKADGTLKSTSEMMSEIGDHIRDMSRQEQVAILSRLGIDPKMVEALTGDMSELTGEFDSLYSTLGVDIDKAAQASSDFMDSQFKLKYVFDALKKSLAIAFMPQLQRSMDALRKNIIANLPRIMETIKPIMAGVLKTAGIFVQFGSRVGQIIGKVIGVLMDVNKATGGWTFAIMGVIAAWKLLNLSILLSPVGMVLALSAALVLLYDDFMTFKEGGESLINWANWTEEIDIVIDYFKLLWSWIDTAVSGITNVLIALIQVLTGDFSGAWETVQFQIEKFMKVFEKGKALMGKVGGYFGIGGGDMDVSPDIPASAQAGAGGSSTVNQTVDIKVESSANPEVVGRAVKRELEASTSMRNAMVPAT